MKKIENLEQFKLLNEEMQSLKGGTYCFVSGNRSYNGQTWMDIERVNSMGDVLEVLCEQPDEDWGGRMLEVGEQIC